MKLYKHQRELVEKAPKKWLLAHGCGSGKTLTSIILCEKEGLSNVLIVCPKSIKEQWQEQISFYAKEKRLWTVMTKEEFKKKVKTIPKYKKIVIDEAHFFFNFKSGLSKALLFYIEKYKPTNIYLLTATPYTSSIWSIYTAALILGKQTKRDWYKWKIKYFYDVRMGKKTVPVQKKMIGNEKMEDHVARIVNAMGNAISLEECRDVPEQTFLIEYFDLTKEQKTVIESLNETTPIVYWTKVHQICGGTLKGDGYVEDKFIDSEKLKRIKELVSEHKKIVIVCRYNNELKVIHDSIKADKKIIINGKTKDKNALVKEANLSENCVVLVNASCSEGYELPSFPIMVFYSYDFALKNFIQMKGRILRANALKKNVYISLVVKGTIDEDVYKCVMAKRDFDVAIYNLNK